MANINAMIVTINMYNSSLDKMMLKTEKVINKLAESGQKIGMAAEKILKAGSAIDKASTKMIKASQASEMFVAKMLELNKAAEAAAGGINEVEKKLDETSSSAKAADDKLAKFNNKVNDTEKKTKKAKVNLDGMFKSLKKVISIENGMKIYDDYTKVSTKLNQVNDGNQKPGELQDKVFAAAGRSRSSFADMSDFITKLENGTDVFGSNDETIAFTELVQRSFVASGTTSKDSKTSIDSLIEKMSTGGMKGDDLNKLSQTAPLIMQAVSQYTGVSGADLKKLADEGQITADVMKNAIFSMSGDINTAFAEAPMTFSDIFTRIKDGGLQAFTSIIEKVQEFISNPQFQQFVNALIVGFDILANVIGTVIDGVINGWSIIGPILATIGATYLVSIITGLWATIPPLIGQALAWISASLPILLIIGLIVAVISIVDALGISWESVFKFMGGVIGEFIANVQNVFIYIWNFIAEFINFFGNAFRNTIIEVKMLFNDLAISALGAIENLLQSIQDLINKIPGVTIDITSGISNFKDKFIRNNADLEASLGEKEYAKVLDLVDTEEAKKKGENTALGLYNGMESGINSLADMLGGNGENNSDPFHEYTKYTPPSMDGKENPLDPSGTGLAIPIEGTGNPIAIEGGGGIPIPVKGSGTGGTVEVEMPDEDLDYLREIAERDYIANIASNSLAPNISVQFGDVHETADADKVAGRIKQILQEEIAMVSEGVY
ncbi:hypothetical protein acsn021_01610 [Anaerocolumna cellulosilytica]|uniref:Tape measure protein N-terminal domain-containing protein n=1 Tax=Anaerocolumna cellulosilytica TaxID=433286 RepID=A0A6S6QZ98_9FIRM|nr:tape measure protein [Anaerocolumna cellulosilytica]MBB5197935.1 tape measure domain-containing protein [Anaerocolumna cellulosilytica]BCJ92592.1 hypothetical protein acsn021_01610 [Anaerocolumna cellulosilytica]